MNFVGASFQSSNDYWWPNRLDLSPLRQNDKDGSSPYGPDFDYAREFESLDLEAVKNDLTKLMTTPQEWWPPDFGHYGPFFIRMAWHSAGTYRVIDGRGGVGGGQQRFEPLNSWPDNVNLDKARRLLLPIKQKYGRKLSWADLMILAGNVALETMGFNVLGFGGGRKDNWQADMTYWGSEKQWLKSERRDGNGELEKPLAAVQMGLIYVNPEGPNGNPDPLASARSIRESFGLMAMNDEETVALIVGGHSFGKAHGAASAERNVGPAPAAENIEHQGFGWRNGFGSGRGPDTISSGLEGAWTPTPTRWSPMYLQNLLGSEWNLTRSPAGATQWTPAMMNGVTMVPDAHREWKRHLPMMFTSDMALKMDPTYRKISERFRQNPAELEDAFAKAWFKLTHRDMGPLARYKGQDVPKKTFVWQDPIPERTHELINDQDIIELKSDTMTSGLPITDLVFTAWASASTFRKTDKRGGANGARISMEPQKNWQVNDPKRIARVIEKLKEIQNEFHRRNAGSGKKVSLADLIVLAGCAAVEAAARAGGKDVKVKFDPGRMDAQESETDAASFSFLEPKFDGFRNYHDLKDEKDPKKEMIEKAAMLSLTVPETVVLVGGMRVLGANTGLSKHGVFTDRPGVLTNDFFKNLIDMDTVWTKTSAKPDLYEGRSRSRTRALKWTATAVDLIFGHNSELRAVVEVYGSDDAEQMFLDHFTKAWSKVMNLDRFDL